MTEIIAGVELPETELVREATSLVLDAAEDAVFHHSRRVFLWGTLQTRAKGWDVDPELAYVGGLFHDLGLTAKYATTGQRFEVDGADVAFDFLKEHGRSEQDARNVWLGIALHTTPGIPEHLGPEVAVVSLGVETDVLGLNLDRISHSEREDVLASHPRPDFKRKILKAFYEGMRERPDTTFGTMNDDVLTHFDPSFKRANFVDIIQKNDWPE
ncbi:HD superfamily phosphodiesterase [Arthrobacter bambusae]|uniref:HD superfamily phosphodiesterase n=1 Tax=Arthrobacter bambusae TaxID=1338426 RepID=A0ABV2P1C7_9MICC